MSITTTPGASDRCHCGHNGLAHDSVTQACRFSKDTAAPCGCVSFGYPGTMGNRPPVTNAPALTGPAQGPNAAVQPAAVGNRNG